MNPDRNPNLHQDNYYLLKDNSQHNLENNTYGKAYSADQDYAKLAPKYPQQVIHQYKTIEPDVKEFNQKTGNQDQNAQYPSLQGSNSSNHGSNQMIQPKIYQPINQPQNQVVYVHNVQPNIAQRNYNNEVRTTHVIVAGSNIKASIMYGQTVPCQKCGLVSNGPLALQKGRTVCAWATCLFLTTGIFYFLPCVIEQCKDTTISCPRCGHKKAVVKSGCCC